MADSTHKCITIKAFQVTPRAIQTCLDAGKENYRFQILRKNTGLTVFFTDPYPSWQRGTNANTNDLLRQYFPKGSSFKMIHLMVTMTGC